MLSLLFEISEITQKVWMILWHRYTLSCQCSVAIITKMGGISKCLAGHAQCGWCHRWLVPSMAHLTKFKGRQLNLSDSFIVRIDTITTIVCTHRSLSIITKIFVMYIPDFLVILMTLTNREFPEISVTGQLEFPPGLWILADSAYPCPGPLITPYREAQIRRRLPHQQTSQRYFNFLHRSRRVYVEHVHVIGSIETNESSGFCLKLHDYWSFVLAFPSVELICMTPSETSEWN